MSRKFAGQNDDEEDKVYCSTKQSRKRRRGNRIII